jgi:hypothetical protein
MLIDNKKPVAGIYPSYRWGEVELHSLVKGGGGLEKNDGPRQDVLLQNRTTEPMDASKQFLPERGVFGTRQTRSGQ